MAFAMKTLDLYILKKAGVPMAAAVGIALMALLLDRLVHVLDLVVNKGGPSVLLLEILAELIPPYLGLSLPAALFAGVLLAAMRLSDNSELDALQAAGIGLARVMLPLMALSVVTMIGGTAIFSVIQPHAFFSYRSLLHMVANTTWDATLQGGDFFTGFGGRTILIDHISGVDRGLSGIFIYEPRPDGSSVTITAQSGTVLHSAIDAGYVLHLVHGTWVALENDHKSKMISFVELDLPLVPAGAAAPLRNRGDNIRELTLPELWRHGADVKFSARRIRAELHGRLVRIASFLVLPILAFPLGVRERRARRSVDVVVGILLLVLFNYSLQLGESLAATGRLSPLLSLWLPLLMLAAFSGWNFYAVCRSAGQLPLTRLLGWLTDAALRGVTAAMGRKAALRPGL